jgi:hypothetical protein
MGPEGPRGTAADVRFSHEDGPDGRPRKLRVEGRGPGVDVTLDMEVEQVVATALGGPMAAQSGPLDFLQMRVRYHVTGTAAGQALDFRAPGSAETFRGRKGP